MSENATRKPVVRLQEAAWLILAGLYWGLRHPKLTDAEIAGIPLKIGNGTFYNSLMLAQESIGKLQPSLQAMLCSPEGEAFTAKLLDWMISLSLVKRSPDNSHVYLQMDVGQASNLLDLLGSMHLSMDGDARPENDKERAARFTKTQALGDELIRNLAYLKPHP